MRTDVITEDGLRILRPDVDAIDPTTIDEFRDDLEGHCRDFAGDLILDLGAVSYVGSVGIGLVSRVGMRLKKEGRSFVIVASRDEVLRLLAISGVSKVLEVVETVDDARRFLEARGRGGVPT